MIWLHSTAVCPPSPIVEFTAQMKNELSQKIGWFYSKNSLAHITFNEFLANASEFIKWRNFIQKFCNSLEPFEINLVKTGQYSNGAFYLSPDENSKKILTQLMKQFNKETPYKTKFVSTDPHMSIGRRLSPEGLKIANQLWGDKTFDLKFTLDNLAIRKFNEHRQQYDILERFSFNNDRSHLLF